MNQALSFTSQIGRTGAVAVLIDGENISAAHADAIMRRAGGFGQMYVRRVYGDARLLERWDEREDMRMIHTGTGKNGADIRLTIDAVELAHLDQADAFVIATSDADFTHLAHFLRERGRRVIGMGEGKAPERFRKACSDFVCLSAEKRQRKLSDLEQILCSVIAAEGSRRGLRICDLNPLIRRRNDKIRISTLPDKTWRTFLQNRADLVDCDERGPDAHVRVRDRRA